MPRWDWLATRAHRHWVESNDVEHVVESFESFVGSLNRLLDPTVVVEIWFCLMLSISEEVVKTRSSFGRLSSKTDSKAALYESPLDETSAEVWPGGVASSAWEPRRGRFGVETFGRFAVELVTKF